MEKGNPNPSSKYIPFVDRYSLQERKAKFEKQMAEYILADAESLTSYHSSSRNIPSPNCH